MVKSWWRPLQTQCQKIKKRSRSSAGFFIKQKNQPDLDMVAGSQEEKRELKYTTFILEANPNSSS